MTLDHWSKWKEWKSKWKRKWNERNSGWVFDFLWAECSFDLSKILGMSTLRVVLVRHYVTGETRHWLNVKCNDFLRGLQTPLQMHKISLKLGSQNNLFIRFIHIYDNNNIKITSPWMTISCQSRSVVGTHLFTFFHLKRLQNVFSDLPHHCQNVVSFVRWSDDDIALKWNNLLLYFIRLFIHLCSSYLSGDIIRIKVASESLLLQM